MRNSVDQRRPSSAQIPKFVFHLVTGCIFSSHSTAQIDQLAHRHAHEDQQRGAEYSDWGLEECIPARVAGQVEQERIKWRNDEGGKQAASRTMRLPGGDNRKHRKNGGRLTDLLVRQKP